MIVLWIGLALSGLLIIAGWSVVRQLGAQFHGAISRLTSMEGGLPAEPPKIIVPIHDPVLPALLRRQGAPRRAPEAREGMPTLLYICPVIPSNTGSGLAIRAGNVLRLLAERYRVWLLSVPVYSNVYPMPLPFADLCEDWAVVAANESREALLSPWVQLPEPPGGDTPVFAGMTFDMVHVFRLYSIPVARFYLDAGRLRQLDLDDVESKTHRRHADLRRARGDAELADFEEMRHEEYRRLEDEIFGYFDRIFVCSDLDRKELQVRTAVPVSVLPNAMSIPPVMSRVHRDGPFQFLFIGSLGYFPNQEAVYFFALEVMPLIRKQTAQEFKFVVAGTGSDWIEETVAPLSDVEVVGWVADVARVYATADVVVAPLASGGGTRVKVLEAFSYHRPVVSTPLGAEGINVTHGDDILIGESPEEFAAQCLRLMEDTPLAQRLADNAFDLLQREYSVQALRRYLDAQYEPVSATTTLHEAAGSAAHEESR